MKGKKTTTEGFSSTAGGEGVRASGRDVQPVFPCEHDPLLLARRALADGKIVALRGLGGYQLACNAFDRQAVAELRRRKHRPDKPLAVMLRDIHVARRLCKVSDEAADLLSGPIRPICICDTHPDQIAATDLPLELLSPDSDTLGIMLPTTPLHLLLFSPLAGDDVSAFDVLVMTSGNHGGEPICTANQEAFVKLGDIADMFLTHDRDINFRCDDSLVIQNPNSIQLWRRARGYVPERLFLSRPLKRSVLALGAELKNTVALGRDDEVIASPHIGDLETPEAVDGLEQVVTTFPDYFKIDPAVIAVDMHPDMHSTRRGRAMAAATGAPLVEVQHHHAHAAAVMAEHGLDQALALVFDGTGLGPDASIWGAELLACEGRSYERLATFSAVPLPGGDYAVRYPPRQAVARWAVAGSQVPAAFIDRYDIDREQIDIWKLQAIDGINAPLSHAAGRLFDAVAAVLGISPAEVSFEGQAAIRLESFARRQLGKGGQRKVWVEGRAVPGSVRDGCLDQSGRGDTRPEQCDIWDIRPEQSAFWGFRAENSGGLLLIHWSDVFARLAEAIEGGVLDLSRIELQQEHALEFHLAVARAAQAMIAHGVEQTGWDTVVLSGGVFMNRILTQLVSEDLSRRSLEVYCAGRIPPNDGGISVGQAVIAGGEG